MTDKLVIDTCVFVEGIFNPDENASEVILSNFDSIDARMIFSQDTIGELFYILKKQCNDLEMSYEETNEILLDIATLFQNGKSVNTNYYKTKRNKIKARDENDQMFIDAALSGQASHIITLDKKSGILNLKKVPFKCCNPDTYLKDLSQVKTTNQ